MFERFTDSARRVVIEAQAQARRLGDREIAARHVLLALVHESGSVADLFAAAGADEASLLHEVRLLGSRPPATGSLSPGDAEALASLGIDLDAVRERVEARFGRGALDRAPGGRRHRWRRRPGERSRRRSRSGHILFAPGAKKALELSLREAIRLRDREIADVHVALGLLRCGDREVTAALYTVGVDQSALHAALERSRRPAA